MGQILAPFTFYQGEVLKRGFTSVTCSAAFLTTEGEGTGRALICFANCAPDKSNTPNLKASEQTSLTAFVPTLRERRGGWWSLLPGEQSGPRGG